MGIGVEADQRKARRERKHAAIRAVSAAYLLLGSLGTGVGQAGLS